MLTFHLNFRGRVQGVGFRYTAQNFAKRYALNGWVKNLHNGDVEMFVQGSKAEYDSFFKDLSGYFSQNINDVNVKKVDLIQSFKGFEIRY